MVRNSQINLTLISNENLIFSGASTNTLNTSSIADTPLNLTLHMTSNQGQYGKATISLTVTDANGLTDTQSDTGTVYVYQRNGTVWTQGNSAKH
jgi:hypothetical protein